MCRCSGTISLMFQLSVELSFVLKDPLYDYEIFIQLKNVRKKSTFLQYEILQGIPIKLIEMLISEIL